ncbi:MAG: tetratricopeptide repeat protein [Phycisphaerales bacterium]|nr:tetratricopeptide repeat protein [Phycisphaerales bacterium]MCB9856047.1 tetratricopeptide repeat protein [Phycisphaerales bacterium]MCB9863925.1 tetratricopeptide repeat protein [Phycisphaerales bacterium]
MTNHDRSEPAAHSDRATIPAILVFSGLIIVGALAAFRPALDAGFLNWDDDRNFVLNTSYRGLGADNFRWAWNTYHVGVWQPAAWALLGAEHLIAGVNEAGAPNPGVYHAFSIALHTANGLLLFALLVVLLRAAWRDKAARDEQAIVIAAGATALLFVVHPLRTEPAVWISSQPYLPGVFFAMLSALIYLRGQSKSGDRRSSWPTVALAFAVYCIAVLFKAVAITLPAVLLIADIYPLRRLQNDRGSVWKRIIRILGEKAPFFIVAFFIAKHASASKEVWQPGADVSGLPFADRLVQSFYGVVFYLAKTIVPTGLSPFYELPKSFSLADPRFGGAIAFVVVGVVALFAFRRRAAAIIAGMSAFVVILVPNLGIIQISQQLVADRYSYFSSVPLAALVAGGLYVIVTRGALELRRMRVMGVILAVLVASLSLVRASRSYSAAWHDSNSLWSYALTLDPNSPHAHCNLGAALIAEGDYPAAAEHLRRAIELRSDFVFAYSNLGLVLMELQEWQASVDSYEKALLVIDRLPAEDREKTMLGLANARFELGIALTNQEDWKGVVDCYEKLSPEVHRLPREIQAQVAFGLATAYFELGDQKQAWKHLREAQQLGIPEELVEQAIQRY